MTVGRFFANSSVVTGLMLGTANTIFAQPQSDWGYGLVGEKPISTAEELKNLVDSGGWFTWPVVAWVALAVAIIALLLHLRRQGNSAPPPLPSTPGGMNFLDINGPQTSPPPPPPSEKKDEKLKEGEPATQVRSQIRMDKVEKGDKKAEEPNQPPPPPPPLPTDEENDETKAKTSNEPPPPPPAASCLQCTAPIKEGQKFCIFCGWDLSAAPVEPTQEEVGEPAPPSENSGEKKDEQKGKVAASAASAATGVVVVALLMFGFAGFANAAPTIDYCTPPLLAWDGQPRTFECVGKDLAGLSGAKVSNIPEVSGTVVRSTPTTATLRLKATRNLNASYNSVEFAINGNRVGKPIVLVSPQEAGKASFFHAQTLREVREMLAALAPPVVDVQARKAAAEALRLAKEAVTRAGRSDPTLLSRITELEESLKTRPTEAEVLTIARKEATGATASLSSDLDGAKREVSTTLETFRTEMRAGLDKAEATTRALDGRVSTVETNAARDRAVLQATVCAVVADNGGWLGQGPSNRHKRAIRSAATSAGYPACPKK